MPPKAITVQCPRCGTRYDDWYRPSLNLDIEEFDDDYVREATTATCPRCGTTVTLETLVVRDGVWTRSKRIPPLVESNEPNPEDLTEEEDAWWYWRSWKESGEPPPKILDSLEPWEQEIVRRVFEDE